MVHRRIGHYIDRFYTGDLSRHLLHIGEGLGADTQEFLRLGSGHLCVVSVDIADRG